MTEIEDSATNLSDRLLDLFTAIHNDKITSDWLIEKHPILSKDEAEKYRLFCKSHTIVLKGCYGEGEIMWPLWIASNIK